MSIEKLKGEVADLLDTLETAGDVCDLDSYSMQSAFENAARVIHMLEGNRDLGHLVLGRDLDHTMLILKGMAVTLYKAKDLQDRLEDITGFVDWYEVTDVVDSLNNAIDEEVDHAEYP